MSDEETVTEVNAESVIEYITNAVENVKVSLMESAKINSKRQ